MNNDVTGGHLTVPAFSGRDACGREAESTAEDGTGDLGAADVANRQRKVTVARLSACGCHRGIFYAGSGCRWKRGQLGSSSDACQLPPTLHGQQGGAAGFYPRRKPGPTSPRGEPLAAGARLISALESFDPT